MLKVLTEAAKFISNCDCFVCIILTHGSKDGLYGTDDELINLETVTSLFRRDECPSLDGKPKIFLVEAYQRPQPGGEPAKNQFSIPSLLEYDFLIFCHNVAPLGRQGKRHGPSFQLASFVVDVFEEYAAEEHLMDMMLRVNRRTKINAQMPPSWLVSTLTMRVRFLRKLSVFQVKKMTLQSAVRSISPPLSSPVFELSRLQFPELEPKSAGE